MIRSCIQDSFYFWRLLKLLRTYNYSEQFTFRKVLLSREGRFLAGTMLSYAIELSCSNAVILATTKIVDDCLALAIIDFMKDIQPQVFDASFESNINSIKYIKELLNLRYKDEIILITNIAQSLTEIQDAVNRIRSLGLVIKNCFALVNDFDDKQKENFENNVDLGIKLFFIYKREDFLD